MRQVCVFGSIGHRRTALEGDEMDEGVGEGVQVVQRAGGALAEAPRAVKVDLSRRSGGGATEWR